MNYEAINHDEALDEYGCKDLYICRDCVPPPPKEGESGLENCKAITDYQRYYASEYGSVRGATNMKKEILKRGPIACGIQATEKLEKTYIIRDGKSYIYSEYMESPMINHEVSVVGWGVEDQKEYWIVRNSWGTYWGENGNFKLSAEPHYDMGITEDCVWAVASFTPQKEQTEWQIQYQVKNIISFNKFPKQIELREL